MTVFYEWRKRFANTSTQPGLWERNYAADVAGFLMHERGDMPGRGLSVSARKRVGGEVHQCLRDLRLAEGLRKGNPWTIKAYGGQP